MPGVLSNLPFHLAIVSPYPPAITGIGQYGYHVSRLLAESGVFSKITILSSQNGFPNPSPLPASVELVTGWKPERLEVGGRILAALRKLKPDLVWFNLGVSVFGKSPLANLSGFFGPAGAHILRMPSVVTLHELPELANLPMLKAPGGRLALHGARLLVKLATRADVVCLTMQHYADWLAVSRPGPRYLHIPTGAYYPPEILPEPETPELLFFSTLAPFKGLDTLFNAFRILRNEYPALRLTVAGTEHIRFPDYPQQFKAQFGELSGARWVGQVPEDSVRGLFQRASVLVLPYRASTGSSSALMQAAAWGRPIIASDLSDFRAAAIETGLDVTYFKPGKADALVDALRLVLASRERRQSQVRNNFAVMQCHSPDILRYAYLQAFNLALEARRSPQRIENPAPTEPA